MEIKHWFWLADAEKPVETYGWITGNDVDRLLERQRARKEAEKNG